MDRLFRTRSLRYWVIAAACTVLGLQVLPQRREPEDARGARVWPDPPASPAIRFVTTISGPGESSGHRLLFQRLESALFAKSKARMIRPVGLAAKKELLYVTDPGVPALLILDLRRSALQTITKAGGTPLVSPIGVAVGQDRVFLSDSYLRQVFVYDRRGRFLKSFGGPELHRPTGLAFDERSGRLYVADTTAHRIVIYNADGKTEKSIGARGTGHGELNYPAHLWLDAEGRLFVVDSLNYRIQVFRPDGAFLGEFGRHGDGSGDFASPKGIAADSRGHVYVVDALFDTVQMFDQQGQLLLTFGERGAGPSQFWLPAGLFIDERDRIYVADSHNHRVQVFEFVGGRNGGR